MKNDIYQDILEEHVMEIEDTYGAERSTSSKIVILLMEMSKF